MESLIPSNNWRAREREVAKEIMKTDVFVKVLSETVGEAEMEADIDTAFRMFRDFESRQSRFRPDSELSRFNASEEMIVSSELFSLFESALRYHGETGGVFDPSILPALVSQGYGGSFGTDAFGVPKVSVAELKHTLRKLSLDPATKTARKPKDLQIDLGGIGKGYIVDRVADFLRNRYRNCFVYAGGDIYAAGKNRESGYEYWAVDVENPIVGTGSLATLLLSDKAVATSGTGRRRWNVGGEERHHLIDPRTGKSAETDLVSVTVVAETVEQAEVFSKTLVILGSERAKKFAEEKRVPAFFVTREGKTVYNDFIEPYVWKP